MMTVSSEILWPCQYRGKTTNDVIQSKNIKVASEISCEKSTLTLWRIATAGDETGTSPGAIAELPASNGPETKDGVAAELFICSQRKIR
jgi:hypothetical protein